MTDLASIRAPASSPITLSWKDIVQVIEHHPLVAAGKVQREAAAAGVEVARALPNPSLAVSMAYARSKETDKTGLAWNLALEIPLSWIAGRQEKIAVAQAEQELSSAEVNNLRRSVMLQLYLLFWQLVYAQQRAELLEELARQTAALSQMIETRVRMGDARPAEGLRVKVELEKLRGEAAAAQGTLLFRRQQLGLWLRHEQRRTLRVQADLTLLPTIPDLATVRAKIHTAHPTLLAGKARLRKRSAELQSEKLARVPSFSLQAFTEHELDARYYGAGITMDLPLWNWGSSRIAQAEARLRSDEQRLAAEVMAAEAEAIEARAQCQSAVTQARSYQQRVVPLSASAASLVERAYQLGETRLLELIDARKNLVAMRRQYLALLAQAQTSCSQLRALIGEEMVP